MKKVILLLLIAATIVSCKKNETTTPAEKQEAEVSFNVTTIFPEASREWDYDVPPCDPDAVPTFAKIKIDGIEGPDPGPNGETSGYWDVPVFWTNNNLYTQAIKLPVNSDDCYIDDNGTPDNPDDDFEVCCSSYTLTEFYLYAEGDNGAYMIKAAPLPDSEFYEFIENGLDLTFQVCAFEKVELYIDVLCFMPDMYELFGFFWFEITEITVREMCFFGDICVGWFPYNIEGDKLAWWMENATGYGPIEADMPAIFKLTLKKWIDLDGDGEVDHPGDDDNPNEIIVINEWDNEAYAGTGMPLCIRYADYDNETDVFFLELSIWAPYGDDGVFSYGPTDAPHGNYIWEFTDDAAPIDLNGDGVVEFAWGDCVQDPEYHLPEDPQGK